VYQSCSLRAIWPSISNKIVKGRKLSIIEEQSCEVINPNLNDAAVIGPEDRKSKRSEYSDSNANVRAYSCDNEVWIGNAM